MVYYSKIQVDSPKKIRNPILSVVNPSKTAEPIAGSLPILCKIKGTITPTSDATSKFRTKAPAITKPKLVAPYNHHVKIPATLPQIKPLSKAIDTSFQNNRAILLAVISPNAKALTIRVTV